jgi:non-ribosomal peptide synthetase component F
MVGLMINTVPVRAHITPEATAIDLLDQIQGALERTFEHQHLALSDVHRVSGHARLFDTVFVYENYPIDTAGLSGGHDLGITKFTVRDYYHYPLTVQAVPGDELDLRVQFRTDVFDPAGIDTLMERFEQILQAMTADPTERLLPIDPLDADEFSAEPEFQRPGPDDSHRAPVGTAEQILADIFGQVLDTDRVGVEDSFFDLGGDSLAAVRAITAINSAFDTRLPVAALFEAPSVNSLSNQLGAIRAQRM